MPNGAGSELVFNETLGRAIRSASAGQLGTPTDVLLLDAVTAHDQQEAMRLLDYLIDEAGRVFTVLVTWLGGELEYGRTHVSDWSSRLAALERVIGAPPPLESLDTIAAPEATAARRLLAEGDTARFPAALHSLRQTQWRVHDELTDWLWGLLTALRDALGENAMGEVLRVTVREWFDARYASLPSLSPRESFELVIEGARGHFSGPDHSGSIEVDEDDEKWVMSFDPCGSGGRMRRGDDALGQTPRTEAPYGFGSASAAHDWTWQKEGVCLYCAHCSFANEILAIEHQGTPMRVTEYPERPGDKCTWTIYKRPADVPAQAYHRVGKEPPDARDR